jgi:hypothetical protein
MLVQVEALYNLSILYDIYRASVKYTVNFKRQATLENILKHTVYSIPIGVTVQANSIFAI